MINKIFFDSVSLSFADNKIFDNLSVELNIGKVIVVTGANGAGKSTFLKLAGQFIQPDSGSVTAFDSNEPIERINFRQKIAAITPSMNLYSELTAAENIKFFVRLCDKSLTDSDIDELFARVNLNVEDKFKLVGNFSTGMKQRLKFAIMLAVEAEVWLLDEPGSNLDEAGKQLILGEITNAASNGKLILMATNDRDEVKMGDEVISLPIR